MATGLAIGAPAAAGADDPSVSIEGEVQRVAVDLRSGASHEITLVVPDEGDPVRVRGGLPGVATGERVLVRLADAAPSSVTDPAGGADVLEWSVVEPVTGELAEAPLAAITGAPRPVAVVTTRVPGQTTDGRTPADIAAYLTDDVAPYYADSTDDLLQLGVGALVAAPEYAAWGTGACTEAQVSGLLAWAEQQAGVYPTLGQGRHALVYTPIVPACEEILAIGQRGDGGSVWINGYFGNFWVGIAHELGYTLTLGDSLTRTACFASWGALVPDGGPGDCDFVRPNDPYDVMGGYFDIGAGPLSGAHLAQMGLMPTGASTTVAASETITLQAVAGGTGLRFATFATGGVTYHVEYRGAVGRDADLGIRQGFPTGDYGSYSLPVAPGVLVRRADVPGSPDTYLMDAGVMEALGNDPIYRLADGMTFESADQRVTVTQLSSTDSAAQVRIRFRETPHAQILISPDLTGWGKADVVAVDGAGDMYIWEGQGNGRPGVVSWVGSGWSDLRVFAPGNWDGISGADLVATDPAGDLWLYRGRGGASFSPRQKIGFGWSSYRIVPAGDMNGDKRNDLLAMDSVGRLWLYPGAGGGVFGKRIQVGNGWTGFELYAAGDANRDGRNDILSVDSAGRLWFYSGRGGGYFNKRVQVGYGWTGYTFASGADLNGDGSSDLLGRDASGRLWFYAGKGAGTFAKKVLVGTDW